MVDHLPILKESKHFMRLPHKWLISTYRFKTTRDIEIGLTYPIIPNNYKLVFRDQKGKARLTLYPQTIRIHGGYAWDGCTPKVCIFGKWFGSPDFEPTILASLVHDSLLQFHLRGEFPLTREQCDEIFKEILIAQDFQLASVYGVGVDIGTFLFE